VKLLFDENVSPKLPHMLANEYPGSVHIREVGLRGAEDRQIWDYGRARGFAIVSNLTSALFENGP
jgi:predicted nuclease of predicted toxin-antitoxin system